MEYNNLNVEMMVDSTESEFEESDLRGAGIARSQMMILRSLRGSGVARAKQVAETARKNRITLLTTGYNLPTGERERRLVQNRRSASAARVAALVFTKELEATVNATEEEYVQLNAIMLRAVQERDHIKLERDQLRSERDQLRSERDQLRSERDQLKFEQWKIGSIAQAAPAIGNSSSFATGLMEHQSQLSAASVDVAPANEELEQILLEHVAQFPDSFADFDRENMSKEC